MAYEALDSLQQTLTQILKRDDDLTTHRVKQDIISIHDKAIVLQLNLKVFPEKETIREVASTTLEIIEYLFSPENLSNCGSMDPTVRVSNQLRELAKELDSVVGDVVDYFKINDVRQQSAYPTFSSSSSRSALVSSDAVVGIDENPTVSMEPIVKLSHRLRRFVEKILSSPQDSAGYSRSNDDDSVNSVRRLNDSPRSAPTSKDVVVGIDENPSYSAADSVSSSSSRDGVVGFEEVVIQILDRLISDSRKLIGDSPKLISDSRKLAFHNCKDGVVGFEEDLVQIMDRLLGGSLKLEVFPIVGMGGIGKTTLAKIVYDHPLVMEHFDIHAWITISQNFSLEITCLNLLASMKGKGIRAENDPIEIHKHLWGRRYLIVMDDIWSITAWDRISLFFPDNNCGSRIILTTRLRDVAYYFSRIHEMRFLDEQQSWDLFQRKVFADQTCPLELQSAAKKIVTSCGGLPLSIVTKAGLLSRIGRTPKFWEQIVATDGDGQSESILSLSYNHLPHHLRACFLYMAGFPEDYEIRVSELIKLWVAEGILEGPYESKSLEETAEEYLKDLVEKSLVLVTSRKIDGKIKSCRLHNNVRDICVRQAGQKKFLLPVKDYLPSPILRRHFLPQLLKNHRRISASWYDLDLKDSMHSSYTHSIICIPQKGYKPKGSVRSFSLLRVLHVLRRDDHSYWELGQVFHLIHLTYLASNIPSSIVPPAISKLHYLKTLIIYRSGVRLPMEIWRLRQLRHLIAFSFDPLPHPEATALPLENFQTLSLATNFVCSRRMVKMMPNIQKLGICYSVGKFDEDYHLDNLTHLLQLEKLKLESSSSSVFYGVEWQKYDQSFPRNQKKLSLSGLRFLWNKLTIFRSLPNLQVPKVRDYAGIVFPTSLKKLTLSGCRLPWRDMTAVVGSLPNLQVLKLRNHACDGEHWENTEGEFGALRLLLTDESNLQHWTTESSHFPRLECLMLHRCPHLSEIPSEIGDIPTLQLIEVDDLNQSLLHSAKMILKEQRDLGNDGLEVRLKSF